MLTPRRSRGLASACRSTFALTVTDWAHIIDQEWRGAIRRVDHERTGPGTFRRHDQVVKTGSADVNGDACEHADHDESDEVDQYHVHGISPEVANAIHES